MSSPIYSLNREHEKGRLDSQHAVFKSITKTLLPDHVHAHLSALGRAPAVADVAAGSGVWLLDLAHTLPATSRLDGFDLDTSKFPRSVAPNVRFQYGDCLGPFPESLHGQYDCVHVRLLATALRAEEWAVVARHLRDLLRSGGWLVWDEMGHTSCTCIPMTEHFQRIIATDVRRAISLGRDVT
jgi:SAM-dependent methyltransferase